MRAYFHSVEEESNVLVLGSGPTTGDDEKMTVPLDRIESVWQDRDGWHVAYRAW